MPKTREVRVRRSSNGHRAHVRHIYSNPKQREENLAEFEERYGERKGRRVFGATVGKIRRQQASKGGRRVLTVRKHKSKTRYGKSETVKRHKERIRPFRPRTTQVEHVKGYRVKRHRSMSREGTPEMVRGHRVRPHEAREPVERRRRRTA